MIIIRSSGVGNQLRSTEIANTKQRLVMITGFSSQFWPKITRLSVLLLGVGEYF